MVKINAIYVILLTLFWPLESHGATIAAASASHDDVEAAVTAASDGDTVTIPAGTAQWTTTVHVNKAIVLIGAGTGQTILQDDVVGTGSDSAVLSLETVSNKTYRLSGIEIQRGVSRTTMYYDGTVQLFGTSKAVRIDHCKWVAPKNRGLYIWDSVCGVIDHCVFEMDSTQGIAVFHKGWADKTYGDGSWSTSVGWGTTNAMYIEDCFFTNRLVTPHTASLDSFGGARWVFRYNVVSNEYIGCHGTESTRRYRGTRSYEIYQNQFYDNIDWWASIHVRSGTGVIWSNTMYGYAAFCVAVNYRSQYPFTPWGGDTGSNVFDVNSETGIFASGFHDGADNATTMTTTNVTWTANQWKGYTIINLDLADFNDTGYTAFSEISDNTANTITFMGAGGFGTNMRFNAGDRFEIRKVGIALDQVGRSTGDLLSGGGDYVPPTPAAWPNQVSEPLYGWGNKLDGATALITSVNAVVIEGRDFTNNIAKPSYTPLKYPHPLTGNALGTMKATNLRVKNWHIGGAP